MAAGKAAAARPRRMSAGGTQRAPESTAGSTRRRVLATGMAGAASPVIMTACGADGAREAAGAMAPTPGVRAAVTVTFMHGGTPVGQEARQENFKAFEAKYPGIKVEHAYYATDNAEKVQAAITAGTPPDVFYVANGADVTTQAARGALQDLQVLAKRDRFDASDMFESALALYQFCGKQYGYPIDFPNQQLYYNLDLLEQVGVKAPPGHWNDPGWTFDRFLDTARQLTKDAAGQPQWGFYLGGTGLRSWYVWVSANGGDLFDKEMKTSTIAEPPAVEALQFLQDLMHKHRVMPTLKEAGQIGGQMAGGLTGFVTGHMAMATLPPWMGQVRQEMRQRWDVAPHPRGNSPKARWACAGGGTGLAMASPAVGAKHINEAWELVKFCELRPQVEIYIRHVGIVPPLKSVADSPVFSDPSQPPKSIKVFTDGAKHLRPDPSIVRWNDINRVITAELGKLWDNSESARSVTESIKRGVDPILKDIDASGVMSCQRGA